MSVQWRRTAAHGAGFNVRGDARSERVSEVWKKRFSPFRDRAWMHCGPCSTCAQWDACLGGSMHNRADDGTLQRCTAQLLGAASERIAG
jgi:hypothetical protein